MSRALEYDNAGMWKQLVLEKQMLDEKHKQMHGSMGKAETSPASASESTPQRRGKRERDTPKSSLPTAPASLAPPTPQSSPSPTPTPTTATLAHSEGEGGSNVEEEQGRGSSVQDAVAVGEGGSNVEEEEGGGSSVTQQDALVI